MDTAVVAKRAAILAVLVLLTACGGPGMSKFNYSSPLEDSEEEKAEDKWWDTFQGRKSVSRESSAWKDLYKAPNQDQTKPDYCGFWGNCAAEGSSNAAGCNYYGNCDTDKKSNWW